MSDALAILGDWNATPHDSGLWSPSWLAGQTGLRIHSAGPGRHGDIDYAMSDAAPGKAHRYAPPGRPGQSSDHDVVMVTVGDSEGPPAPLRLATWNMEFGRQRSTVAGQLGQLLEDHKPDVLALQEAKDYHHVIRTVAAHHGYVSLLSEVSGQWHNGLMVREALSPRAPRFVQLSPRGWHLAGAGSADHTPLWATSWLVGWLRVVCVHMPPSVNWSHGVPHGPVMRVAATVAAQRRLRSWVNANKRHR